MLSAGNGAGVVGGPTESDPAGRQDEVEQPPAATALLRDLHRRRDVGRRLLLRRPLPV